jgi:hypothetical protein
MKMNKPIAGGEGTRKNAGKNAGNYIADALASNSFTSIDKFKLCCREIILEGNANGYAKAYAEYGMKLNKSSLFEAKVQALYILNNLSSWRTANAKVVRTWLIAFTKRT